MSTLSSEMCALYHPALSPVQGQQKEPTAPACREATPLRNVMSAVRLPAR